MARVSSVREVVWLSSGTKADRRRQALHSMTHRMTRPPSERPPTQFLQVQPPPCPRRGWQRPVCCLSRASTCLWSNRAEKQRSPPLPRIPRYLSSHSRTPKTAATSSHRCNMSSFAIDQPRRNEPSMTNRISTLRPPPVVGDYCLDRTSVSQSRPSNRPSPVVAHVDWMYHWRLRSDWS